MADSCECDNSSQNSSYSSTGTIGCSLAKKYDSRPPSATSDENFPETTSSIPTARLTAEDRNTIQDIYTDQTKQTDSRIFPKAQEEYLREKQPHLLQRLKDIVTTGWAFADASILRDLNPYTAIKRPKCVCLDMCIFCASQPIKVLTFTGSKRSSEQTQRYNSQLAKTVTDIVDENTKHSISVVHGVVEESKVESKKIFLAEVAQIESDARKIHLPGTLDMDKDMYSEISQAFLDKLPKSVRLGDKGTKWAVYGGLKYMESSQEEGSYMSNVSRDSGCVDVEEHSKLKKELEELRTENKVLKWKLGIVSSATDQSNTGLMADSVDENAKRWDVQRRRFSEDSKQSPVVRCPKP